MARLGVATSSRRDGKAGGFTLVEMLVTLFCAVALASIVLLCYSAVVDQANRTMCRARLHRLGGALFAYAQEYEGFLPDTGATRLARGRVPPGTPRFNDTWDNRGTALWPHSRNTGNAGNLYLLIRAGLAEPKDFICPATGDKPAFGPFSSRRFSFLAFQPGSLSLTPRERRFLRIHTGRHCSYSYQNVLGIRNPGPGACGVSVRRLHRCHSPPDLAILADHNPYTELRGLNRPRLDPTEHPSANSLNHGGAGQNVLYLGGHVIWSDTPACGASLPGGECDNIYRPGQGAVRDPRNIPESRRDSYLVP